MRKEILTWYWRNNEEVLNFGEHFTPEIIRSFGYNPIDYDKALSSKELHKYDSCLMIIGSELQKEQIDNLNVPKVYIWGQGKGLSGERFDINLNDEHYKRKVKVYAVRGPHTQKSMGLKEDIPLGDPAFLSPLLFPIKREDNGKVIYAPHHKNRSDISTKMNKLGADDYFDVMIPRDNFKNELERIVNSKFVLTNSLHCAIISKAYDVPFAISLLKDEKMNMPEKWKDFCEFLNMPGELQIVESLEQGIGWWDNIGKKLQIPSLKPLIDSFPYPIDYNFSLNI